MPGYIVWSRKFLGILFLLVLLGGGVVAWRERTSILSWFYIRNLAHSSDANRSRWIVRTASLGEAALPGLFNCLTQSDPHVCGNARAAVEYLAQTWGETDARTVDMASRLAREFDHFSPAGQKETLELALAWIRKSEARNEGLAAACAQLIGESASVDDEEVIGGALALCGLLLDRPADPSSSQSNRPLDPAQKLVAAALHSHTIDNRIQAVRLSLLPGMADLLEEAAKLLFDESPLVRRAALVAVAEARDIVHDDQLLPCLHDADPEIRRLCEQVLIARGLRREYIELGRLLTDARPSSRLQVLDRLRESTELDPGLWLRRLSHDPAASVRVASIRAMSYQSFVDLSERIDDMARNDSSPTVRQLARYYLNNPRRRNSPPAAIPSR
jgi:hypothetical protein